MNTNFIISSLLIFFIIIIMFSFIEQFTTNKPSYYPYYNQREEVCIEGMDTTDASSNTATATSDTSGTVAGVPQYQEYNQNNALILATKNAGNIEYLKSKMADYDKMNQRIFDLSANVTNLDDQVTQIIQTQLTYAQQNVPSQPLDITGTVPANSTDASLSATSAITPISTSTNTDTSTNIS